MGSYVTVAEARAQGVPEPPAPGGISNDILAAELLRQSEFIDAATKQWFESRYKSLKLDGNDSRTLFLPVPIIEVQRFYLNSNFTNPIGLDQLSIYDRRDSVRDDRRNPMIKLQGSALGVFDVPDFRLGTMFVKGEQNQKVEGLFGFVEEDGTTPKLIKRAVLKLAIRNLQAGGGNMWTEVAGGGPAASGGVVQSETTDGHTITYTAFSVKPVQAGLNGITNDPEVDRIIDLYRAPIKIAATSGNGGPDRRW